MTKLEQQQQLWDALLAHPRWKVRYEYGRLVVLDEHNLLVADGNGVPELLDDLEDHLEDTMVEAYHAYMANSLPPGGIEA